MSSTRRSGRSICAGRGRGMGGMSFSAWAAATEPGGLRGTAKGSSQPGASCGARARGACLCEGAVARYSSGCGAHAAAAPAAAARTMLKREAMKQKERQ
jgi:hypothetical protein